MVLFGQATKLGSPFMTKPFDTKVSMIIEEEFGGEIYEVEVKMEDNDRLRHVAHYPIKSGPRTYKSVNIFEIIASSSGKKLVSFWKSRLVEPKTLNVEKETKFECDTDELERLLALLGKLEEVVELDVGNHIFIEKDSPSGKALIEAVKNISNEDSSEMSELMVELVESVADLQSSISDPEEFSNRISKEALDLENLLGYARTSKIVSEFEQLVDDEKDEQSYQDFLEENPWLFGNRYIENTDERKLTRNEEVDFCLATIDGYYDVFEIKKPDHKVMLKDSSHDTFYASSELSKAVSQTQNYLKEIELNHGDILRRNEMDMLKPRGTVVIGRNLNSEQREGLRVSNSYLNRIRAVTYDEIISMGQRLIDMYSVA